VAPRTPVCAGNVCGSECLVSPGICPGSSGCWELAFGCQECKQGFVWRDAAPTPGVDQICVLPEARNRAFAENANAPNTVDNANFPFCLQGFVWREAFGGTSQVDKVCVTVDSRSTAATENALHPSNTVVFGQ
jgi:hypothetical protein